MHDLNNIIASAFALSSSALLAIAAVLATVSFLAALAFLALMNRNLERFPRIVPHAPFFVAVTTAWALSLGFVAADVWGAWTKASAAAVSEREAMVRLAGLTGPDALDIAALRQELRSYKRAVEVDEWGAGANAAPVPAAEEALHRMRLTIIAAAAGGMATSLANKLWREFEDLQNARSVRLGVGHDRSGGHKWLMLIVLTFMSQISIAAVHADRVAAGITAVAIFTIAAFVSLWILSLHANPYTGGNRIDLPRIQIENPERFGAVDGGLPALRAAQRGSSRSKIRTVFAATSGSTARSNALK